MKRHIWYHIVLTIFAAWCGTGCSEGYEYFNPNPGDEEQQASPIVNTGKASVDAAAGKATLNGNCNAMGRTVSEAGFLYGRTAAEINPNGASVRSTKKGVFRSRSPTWTTATTISGPTWSSTAKPTTESPAGSR